MKKIFALSLLFLFQPAIASDINNKIESPHIGISNADMKLSRGILRNLLANEFVLLVQTLNYHWNVLGPEFNDYHKLLEEQYKELFLLIDEVAERTRSVGGTALGSMAEFKKYASLKEDDSQLKSAQTMIRKLRDQHEKLIKLIREGIDLTAADNKDMGTSDFLTGLITKHEKMSWMLRSLLSRVK